MSRKRKMKKFAGLSSFWCFIQKFFVCDFQSATEQKLISPSPFHPPQRLRKQQHNSITKPIVFYAKQRRRVVSPNLIESLKRDPRWKESLLKIDWKTLKINIEVLTLMNYLGGWIKHWILKVETLKMSWYLAVFLKKIQKGLFGSK